MKSSNQFSAWCFSHPDFELDEAQPGIQVTNSGAIGLVDGKASIRQSVILLLTTIPGERVMRADYGCQLHKLIHSPNDDSTHGLAIYYIRTAITRWEPRVEILHLDVQRNSSMPERMEISLVYRAGHSLQEDTLDLSFNLQPM